MGQSLQPIGSQLFVRCVTTIFAMCPADSVPCRLGIIKKRLKGHSHSREKSTYCVSISIKAACTCRPDAQFLCKNNKKKSTNTYTDHVVHELQVHQILHTCDLLMVLLYTQVAA